MNIATASETNNDIQLNYQVKCINCGSNHSAAFRGCPVFQENKAVIQIKTTNKLSYSDALKRYKEIKSCEIQTDSDKTFENEQTVIEVTTEGVFKGKAIANIPGTFSHALFNNPQAPSNTTSKSNNTQLSGVPSVTSHATSHLNCTNYN